MANEVCWAWLRGMVGGVRFRPRGREAAGLWEVGGGVGGSIYTYRRVEESLPLDSVPLLHGPPSPRNPTEAVLSFFSRNHTAQSAGRAAEAALPIMTRPAPQPDLSFALCSTVPPQPHPEPESRGSGDE